MSETCHKWCVSMATWNARYGFWSWRIRSRHKTEQAAIRATPSNDPRTKYRVERIKHIQRAAQ